VGGKNNKQEKITKIFPFTSAALFKIPERLKLHPLFKQFLEDLEVSKHDQVVKDKARSQGCFEIQD